MDRVDALIVGGGPAGSSCARALRKAGLDTLILDAQAFPRTKLCAGWITPSVVRQLDMTPETYPHGFLTFGAMPLEYHGRASVRRFTLRSTQHSIRRYEFDHWLLQRSGARVQQHEVRAIRREKGTYIVDDRFQSRVLVGAGGTQCPVRRLVFSDARPRPRESQVATLEEEFFHPERDEICRLWFREHGLAGYAWFVPKGNGWLNVGLGAFSAHLGHDGRSLREHWGLFVRGLADRGLVRGHAFNPRGHTYYVRAPRQDAQRDTCFLIGDSAGLATRDLGEGIGPAIESGRLAAEAILTGRPYALDNMTKYSYLPPGLITNVAERLLDRDGSFFRDRVFGHRPAAA
jgi:geranylgeranyl reductase family protein